MTLLFDIARVSKSGYYKWLKTFDTQDKDYDDYLLVKEIFEKHHRKVGFRTIKMKLKDEKGIVMNHKKIIRIMKKYDLVCIIRRRNPYKNIMKKTKEHKTFKNLLKREFKQESPYMFFSTDISYFHYLGGLAYLSVIKDIATGEVIAWNLSRRIDIELVLDTVQYMKDNTNIKDLKNVLIHSDQGSHYTSPQYFKLIQKIGMIQSMSRKGNCIDNSPIESFFGHMKDDIDYKQCRSFHELYSLVKEYILYYNTKRQQWNRKKMTPVDYRNHLLTLKK